MTQAVSELCFLELIQKIIIMDEMLELQVLLQEGLTVLTTDSSFFLYFKTPSIGLYINGKIFYVSNLLQNTQRE